MVRFDRAVMAAAGNQPAGFLKEVICPSLRDSPEQAAIRLQAQVTELAHPSQAAAGHPAPPFLAAAPAGAYRGLRRRNGRLSLGAIGTPAMPNFFEPRA